MCQRCSDALSLLHVSIGYRLSHREKGWRLKPGQRSFVCVYVYIPPLASPQSHSRQTPYTRHLVVTEIPDVYSVQHFLHAACTHRSLFIFWDGVKSHFTERKAFVRLACFVHCVSQAHNLAATSHSSAEQPAPLHFGLFSG